MMRRALRTPLLILVAATAIAGTAPAAISPAQAETYGLVVGIDRYQYLNSLQGAVNDARDIADALNTAGAREVITLLDGQATRRNVLDAWGHILSVAKPGDTVVFSYAGHGGQEPERIPGSEDDGKDDAFLLSGFRAERPGNGERLVDDEINQLLRAAGHLKIVFVADSCHSGSMTRGFHPAVTPLGTRLGAYGSIQDDELPPPDPAAAAITLDDLPHVAFFAAVEETQLAPEMMIEGKPRGALSWAFARALRGKADADGNKVLDSSEMERYVIETVRSMSEGRQSPQMLPRGRPQTAIMPISPVQIVAADTPLKVKILGIGTSGGLFTEYEDIVPVSGGDRPDLIWDQTSGQVISGQGDVVAHKDITTAGRFLKVAEKWLLLRDLRSLSNASPLAMRLDQGDRIHYAGEKVVVRLSGSSHGRLTLFNLAADGEVQFIAPQPNAWRPEYSGELPASGSYQLPLKSVPPFGVDHLVAITSPAGLPELEDLLIGLHGTKDVEELRDAIRTLLAGQTYQVGSVGVYTAPGPLASGD